MGLDIKKMITDEFLAMCERRDLDKITIKDIQEKTGLSRQTFYNHFKDKDDLVQYCYDTVLMPGWHADEEKGLDNLDDKYIKDMFRWRRDYLESLKNHARFMKMACSQSGPNNLWMHMINSMRECDLEWHRMLFNKPLTHEMIEATDYHAVASTYMVIDWIMSDMPISPEELTNKIIKNKVVSLGEILGGDTHNNPYMRVRELMEQGMI